MRQWWKRPTLLEFWDGDVEEIMAIDENGTPDLRGVSELILDCFLGKKNSKTLDNYEYRWFTITGVVMKLEHFPIFRNKINEIKYNYWNNGKFTYKNGSTKRVVFHSREIRKAQPPFNPGIINYTEFVNDLTLLMKDTEYTIYSSSIDKIRHVDKYFANPFHPYTLCLKFVLERYCGYLQRKSKKGILLIESRGEKEDAFLLEFLIELLQKGTEYLPSKAFRYIQGVYFNPKRQNDNQASYINLELSDLASYPIHKFARNGQKDKAFQVIEPKIYGYPFYDGRGIKIFP